ncbi:MAG: sulfatase-like hydrolase/transferase [Planctomycetes bacterium]|nr:sulfatase-like hydrolase/transferase [Planctomycetota bacterium]
MRFFLIAVLNGLAVVGAPARGPNMVILYADDMGHGDAGCYGCRDIRTPHIDALAAEAVRFTHYYSAAPICSPSRAALLTGRYPIRAGVPSNVSSLPGDPGMPTTELTVAELARSRGYATALIGKWHLGFSSGTKPNDQGFDEFFGFHAGCVDFYSHMFYWQDPPHHDLYHNHEEIHEEGTYMTDIVAREATRFIEAHRDRPFLVYVAFNAPHYPMQAPERLRRMYADLAPERAIYAAMVTGLDEAIGKIVDALRRAGLDDQTFVFFASDNGATTEMRGNGRGGSNAPYRGHKFSLFDGGIHLPAIVRWPGHVPRGEVREQLVCGIDVLPTVAEIVGAPAPTDRKIDGLSLVPILTKSDAPGHDALFWAQGGQRAVRQGRWKLVLDGVDTAEGGKAPRLTGDDAVFLADLAADPGETRNVRREHAGIVDRLTALHRQWHEDVTSGAPPTSRPKRLR